MKYVLIYILIVLFVIPGCTRDELFEPNLYLPDSLFEKHPDFTELDIPIDLNKPLKLDNIAVDVSLIPLDTKEEAFFRNIWGLAIVDSLVLINTGSNIKYFDKNGKYLSTFENIGQGPGEYETIFGWAVDKNNNRMAIADRHMINIYDLHGGFIKELDLPKPPFSLTSSIAFLDSGYLLVENDRIQPSYEDGFSPLWSINIHNNKFSTLFSNYPDSVYRFRKQYAFMGYLEKTNNSKLYTPWVDSYNTYLIDHEMNIYPKYRLNLGKLTMPLGALYDADNYQTYTRRFAIIHPLIETERYIFIKYTKNQANRTIENYAVYDKLENKIIAHYSDSAGMVSERYPELIFWPRFFHDQDQIICVHEPDTENKNFVLSIISLN